MDYGEHVDIQQVLVPHTNNNWTVVVPTGATCSSVNHCTNATFTAQLLKRKDAETTRATFLPHYRQVFIESPMLHMYRRNLQHIADILPGFALETGMACTWESLGALSPLARQFEPEIFTRLLPTLRNDEHLVVAIYIRTNHADRRESKLLEGQHNKSVRSQEEDIQEEDWIRNTILPQYLPCLQQVEKEYLANDSPHPPFSRVVWLVVSDSPVLKRVMTKDYTTTSIHHGASSSTPDSNMNKKKKYRREILTTTARGVHTRAARSPSTTDFAQAMIDWYLIGESHVVLSNKARIHSFGSTGALRTNRPLYDAGSCTKLTPFVVVDDEEPPLWEDVMKEWTNRNKKKM